MDDLQLRSVQATPYKRLPRFNTPPLWLERAGWHLSITERFVTGVDRAVIFSIACEIDDREGKEGDGGWDGPKP